MKLVKNYTTKNPCYIKGTKINIKKLMLHSVGCSQPSAEVFRNLWNKSTVSVAVHAVVDDEAVIQCLPWNFRGWHSGKGSKESANNYAVGVEMTEPKEIRYTSGSKFIVTDRTKAVAHVSACYKNAVELFAMLCKEHNLDPMTDIISHKEGYKMGVASNHGDPEHLWKGLGLSYTMNTFRKAVKAKMTASTATPEVKPEVKPESASNYPKTPFTVRVLIDNLQYRKTPSFEGAVLGKTGKGSFTITEVSGSWGKLKSGVGWIWLGTPAYTKVLS